MGVQLQWRKTCAAASGWTCPSYDEDPVPVSIRRQLFAALGNTYQDLSQTKAESKARCLVRWWFNSDHIFCLLAGLAKDYMRLLCEDEDSACVDHGLVVELERLLDAERRFARSVRLSDVLLESIV